MSKKAASIIIKDKHFAIDLLLTYANSYLKSANLTKPAHTIEDAVERMQILISPGYFLRLVALELFFKALKIVDENLEFDKTHELHTMYSQLGDTTKGKLLSTVNLLIQHNPPQLPLGNGFYGTLDEDALAKKLKLFSKNLVASRYPFEKYLNRTRNEYEKTGKNSSSKKSPEQFDFVYDGELLGVILYSIQLVLHELAPSQFTPDFMLDREQPGEQERESL
ncbi:hypothetical protein [Desulfovibrio aminophilus]|uniref:hypothetical protein n=1 Tax=Desulfovibrio aminophilus TaxID=81425 RepID=UPI0012EBDA70|nr:hypothetical protein [Desulfovibrio aminophilus]